MKEDEGIAGSPWGWDVQGAELLWALQRRCLRPALEQRETRDREASLVPEAWDQGFGGRQYSSVAGGREREASHVSALVPWAALLSSVETTPRSCRAGTEEEL